MRNFRRTVLLLALFLVVLFAQPAHADDCRVGLTPDGVYPISDADIVLVEEEVAVTLSRESPGESRAECIFVFQNEGPSKDILMGFPAAADLTEDLEDPTTADRTSFHDFKTFRIYSDGSQEEIAVSLRKGVLPTGTSEERLRYSSWYVFSVSFGAGERVILKNTFRARNTIWSNGEVRTGYILRTGALWKGPVGRAKVTVNLGGIPLHALTDLFPGTIQVGPDRLVWEVSDIEPSFDVFAKFNVRFLEDVIESMGQEFAQEVERRKASFSKVLTLDPINDAEELRNMLRSSQSENDVVLGRLIGSMLGEPREHVPSFDRDSQPTVEVRSQPGPTQPGNVVIRFTLFDDCADVLEVSIKVLEGKETPYRVVNDSSYVFSGNARFSQEIVAIIGDWKGPSERYLISLSARDSAGGEAARQYVFIEGKLYDELNAPPALPLSDEADVRSAFPLSALVAVAGAIAGSLGIAGFVILRRRRRQA